MKITSGKTTFEFEPQTPGGAPRALELGTVSALRAVFQGDAAADRFALLDRLRKHVRAVSAADGAALDLTDDELDGLLDALLEIDRQKKMSAGTPTSAPSTTSTPSV